MSLCPRAASAAASRQSASARKHASATFSCEALIAVTAGFRHSAPASSASVSGRVMPSDSAMTAAAAARYTPLSSPTSIGAEMPPRTAK